MVFRTEADEIVLKNLIRDIRIEQKLGSKLKWDEGRWPVAEQASKNVPTKSNNSNITEAANNENGSENGDDDDTTMKLLAELTQKPTVFTTWDLKHLSNGVKNIYIPWASGLVRRPADIVFLTHILIYSSTLLPSAVYLFFNFSWLHGWFHWFYSFYCAGAFTLLMHNHIHGNGVLAKPYWAIDWIFPYVLGPLMGHTWDSYYYHHVKHHHVENNGPGDLSSTIQYQRDSIIDFIKYEARFLAFTWIELPLYFFSKRQYSMGLKSLTTECSSLLLIALSATLNFRPTLFVLILPLSLMRFGMMVGNWGQHCLVDEVDPNSDFRSSITLIDEASNRHCFNDGYHTSHHLNARRHWSEHPGSFIKTKERYQAEGALTFKDIDYIMITVRVLMKDYDTLAKHLVPMGKQISMSHQEKMDMLRTKTRKFSPEAIREKYGKK